MDISNLFIVFEQNLDARCIAITFDMLLKSVSSSLVVGGKLC